MDDIIKVLTLIWLAMQIAEKITAWLNGDK